ncbi:MAG: EpsI family protein [Candidatus Auribacterota bacterium]|jgi:EpsI family protein|nr:EpsI family protein [Candidatus Auribacterota bacterium]
MKTTKQIIAVALLLFTGFIMWFGFYYNVKVYNRHYAQSLPMIIDSMNAREIEMDQKTLDILETTDVTFREYSAPDRIPIYLCIIFSENNRKVAHPPELCLSGGGSNVEQKIQINFDTSIKRNFDAQRLIVNHGSGKWMYLYWYKTGSFYSSKYMLQQFLAAVTQLIHRSSSCALIRLSTPIPPEEEPPYTQTQERLVDFSLKALPSINEKLP